MRSRTAVIALIWACPIWASDSELSLTELYDASRQNDATYQVAGYDYQASQQEEAIGRGGLLPQVGISSRFGRGGELGGESQVANQSDQFSADTATLALRQPLFDKGRWAFYEQSKARGQLGEVQYEGAGQGLFERVAEAYFDVARVENELKLATQQKSAIEGLAKQTKRLFEAGEGAITDTEEAQARLDLIRAQEIELQAQRQAALRKLSGRAGIAVMRIADMQEQLPANNLLPADADLGYWLLKADQASPLLEARRASVQLAEADLKLQQAGHYPTVALTGQLSRTDKSDLNEFSQRQSTYYVGLLVDIPLYQGGAVSASAERAHSALYGARSEYDAEQQQLTEDIERDYLGVVSGFEKSKAMLTAVRSNQRALTSAEKGYQAGVRSTVEILDAQQRLFAAKRDLLNTKLVMLQSYVNLHTRTGQMTHAVLQEVQGLF
ncbi:TolC family outer membrane protein [Pseudomonas sp. 2FG]|uniref:TolC family outer membrane protein n=1 Tax=Pseudomonas sp. 2FG TaxID=2502191 RepID=UPI0010FA1390|nr:TolC family outer membrane protein [Pseudomonas sp. 2FG]